VRAPPGCIDCKIRGDLTLFCLDACDAAIFEDETADGAVISKHDTGQFANALSYHHFEKWPAQHHAAQLASGSSVASSFKEPAAVPKNVACHSATGNKLVCKAWKQRFQRLEAAGQEAVSISSLRHTAARFPRHLKRVSLNDRDVVAMFVQHAGR
jgi:hypothetical protein